jgi:dihydroorotate dehydrogenase
MFYQKVIRPYLFSKDPEEIHYSAFKIGQFIQQYDGFCQLLKEFTTQADSNSEIVRNGIRFPNPVGLAAGFDKNAMLIPLYEALGFGFAEIGSITAQPSPGNPKPRLFRLPDDEAIINRMGLNNDGAEIICDRLKKRTSKMPIGVNIAKTPKQGLSGNEAILDYAKSYALAIPVADYITVNISCPNTGDGKSFEEPDSFEKLLTALRQVPGSETKPLYVKFSADTDDKTLKKLIQISERLEIDGYVAVNTSTQRTGLHTGWKKLSTIGNGGLSGKPLNEVALSKIKFIRDEIGAQKTIIGVGGIMSPDDAFKRRDAGADLIQIYTGLVYGGPFLVSSINKYLNKLH